ncbi:MAG TPA: hypothetical protein VME69_02805, partial [Methylocella sp.]|nr:hypothetical protein [Methylocella sp.]
MVTKKTETDLLRAGHRDALRQKWESLKSGTGKRYRVSALPGSQLRLYRMPDCKEIDLRAVAKGLEMIALSTGDAVFSDAFAVLRSYG